MSDTKAEIKRIVDAAARRPPRCSFCGKTSREVKGMIAAETGALICNECVGLCVDILVANGNL